MPWLLLFLLLLIPMARRLPASYTVWSALALVSTLAGSNLASVERYCWSAFPFVLVAASLLGSRPLWRGVLAVHVGAADRVRVVRVPAVLRAVAARTVGRRCRAAGQRPLTPAGAPPWLP